MRLHPLSCHVACAAQNSLAVHAMASRLPNGDLRLHYVLHAPDNALLIPAPAEPVATDGLWQHTCCEAFIAAVDGPAYREFNFSPSGQWTAYDFADYRQRNAAWEADHAPRITFLETGETCALTAELPAALLPAGAARLGLTVVLETRGGDKSYWALAHAGTQPDFHLAASFTLPLP